MKKFVKFVALILLFVNIVGVLPIFANSESQIISGDVNEDTLVDSKDFGLIKKIAEGRTFSVAIQDGSDLNKDHKVTTTDYLKTKAISLGREVSVEVLNVSLPKQPEINDPGEEIEYTVSGVFTDNMVLQRDKIINVWGWSNDIGGYIYGELFGEKRYAKISSNGEWVLRFSPHEYTTEETSLTIYPLNGKKSVFENILIGDVWLVSGQSNAEYMFSQMAEYYTDSYDFIDEKDNIRLLKIDKSDAYGGGNHLIVKGVQKDIINKNNKWRKTTKASVDPFSALGYMFAKELSKHTDIPQGMVMAAAGGCILQEFMDPATGKNYDNKNAVLNSETNSIYKYYIAPFTHMSMRGVLFYQGESNQGEKAKYKDKLIEFVKGWRKQFDSDFLFYNFQCSTHPLFGDLPVVRDAQLDAYVEIPDSYIIPTIDAGWGTKGNGEDRSHPYDKKTIGIRAARFALAQLYKVDGYDMEYYSCPIPVSATWGTDKVTIDFENVGDGLKAFEGELIGFKFANKKGRIIRNLDAVAKIVDKDTVEVSIPAEKADDIYYVCYAREMNSLLKDANLVNSNDIPTPTFEFLKEE